MLTSSISSRTSSCPCGTSSIVLYPLRDRTRTIKLELVSSSNFWAQYVRGNPSPYTEQRHEVPATEGWIQ